MRVLVADDDMMSRYIITKILADAGFQVTSATHGREAWDILRSENPPRLVVLDWMMPGMDGIEICRRLREHEIVHYTYVLLLTARTYKCDIVAALKAGTDDYLTKPFNRDELVARVRIGEGVLSREEKLTRMNSEWRAMLDTAPFGVVCLSSEGSIRRANRAFVQLSGFSHINQLLGKSLAQTVFHDEVDYRELLALLRVGQPFDAAEIDAYRQDGSTCHIYLCGRPLSGVDDAVYEITTSLVPSMTALSGSFLGLRNCSTMHVGT